MIAPINVNNRLSKTDVNREEDINKKSKLKITFLLKQKIQHTNYIIFLSPL